MKKFKKLFALVAVAVLGLFTLASCGSSAGKIQKAFEKHDYTVEVKTIDNEDSILKGLYLVSNKLPQAIFFELGTTDDLEASIKELQKDPVYKGYVEKYGKDAKEIAKKLKDEGLVNGNCIFVQINFLNDDIKTIFKEA